MNYQVGDGRKCLTRDIALSVFKSPSKGDTEEKGLVQSVCDAPARIGELCAWQPVGGLIAGLYTSDYELMGRSLQDGIVEPLRGPFIPQFDSVKKSALENGALGSGISGSGPSIFALSRGIEIAQKVAAGMCKIYETTGIPYEIHVSKINAEGVKII